VANKQREGKWDLEAVGRERVIWWFRFVFLFSGFYEKATRWRKRVVLEIYGCRR
jgi:hypothetical protein